MKFIQLFLFVLSSSQLAFAGPSAPGMGTGAGSGNSTSSTSLKLPCGGIYVDCQKMKDIIQEKIKSNTFTTVKNLVDGSSLAKIETIGDKAEVVLRPFPAPMTAPTPAVNVCPLAPVSISYKKIKPVEGPDGISEELGDTATYTGKPDKFPTADTEYSSKCGGDIKLSFFEGLNLNGVSGGAPIAFIAATNEVVSNVKINGDFVTYAFSQPMCDSKPIKDSFANMVTQMTALANKSDLKNKKNDTTSTSIERGERSTRHFVLAGYQSIGAAMAQAASCDVFQNAMNIYDTYKKVFDFTLKKNIQGACTYATKNQKQNLKKCFAESSYKKIKEEQCKILTGSPSC